MVRTRAGFTLTELLVATGVFIIGFSAAFTLFLSAVRYRSFADATARNAMAAASQMAEIYLDSGSEGGTAPAKPALYVGSGDATQPPPSTGLATELYVFHGIPGALGRVKASCAVGDAGNVEEDKVTDDGTGPPGVTADGAYATAIQVDLISLVSGDRPDTSSYADLNQRLRLYYPSDPALSGADPAGACDTKLVERGIGTVFRAVIVRHPHWYAYTK